MLYTPSYGNSQLKMEILEFTSKEAAAPREGEGLSKQLVVTEDEDVVYHKLPGGKRKRTTVVHDLMAAVNSGKRPAKKH